MRKKVLCCLLVSFGIVGEIAAQTDSLQLQEVVVTGTRNAVDVRHLPMTVNIIKRDKLVEQHQTSVLPTVLQQVPGI
jgi:iron complex outermembrane receptor protein